MAKRSIAGTTSTGAGEFVHFDPPVSKITALAYGGTGSFTVTAGIDPDHLASLIAASTYPAAGRTISSTSANLISVARATLTATGTTSPTSVIIAGA